MRKAVKKKRLPIKRRGTAAVLGLTDKPPPKKRTVCKEVDLGNNLPNNTVRLRPGTALAAKFPHLVSRVEETSAKRLRTNEPNVVQDMSS